MKRICKRKIGLAGTLAVTLTLLFVASGLAQRAQILNPLYVEARNWWAKVNAAPLPNDIKAPYGQRFGHLSREQQNLWSLAGQVDTGSCASACVTDYNRRVIAWQGSLRQFNHDAENVLHLVPTTGPSVSPLNGGLPPSR